MNEFSISAKLLELRKAKGATQDEVAAALSVSNKTVSKWETGASEPDLNTLIKIARYYKITTDTLLGLRDEECTVRGVLSNQFSFLSESETILKAFDIATEMIPASFDRFCNRSNEEHFDVRILKSNYKGNRFCISSNGLFDFVARYDDVNIAVMLLKNKANFAWMLDHEKQNGIIRFFSALADAAALRICHFLYNEDCFESFTAEYISRNTGVETADAERVLGCFCEIKFCVKHTAHMSDCEVEVYALNRRDGIILSIITLVYELMCGGNSYSYNYRGTYKMIGGDK